ncbi:MAG: NAD(P)-dependent oxidoreductase [Deltaproteobacteria bacterium]|nr:NAD(P)-dependent oxidoreductase [Deltaproteobacteria bacterium]MBW2050858.1 NAD(P)-dependent oxidoreductase [Deltaproteobacteria bacterium]MBW2140178.1 NAD(P)-dependent oxidoreductase [Deltaproteobacteria bacterium]MBW2322299.1 NAD(P)-dependent oxidoreductase [Deltaproteobacteria bacterium]
MNTSEQGFQNKTSSVKVLVTGAGGFIASYLIPELLDLGAEVVAFDIAKNPAGLEGIRDRIIYVRGDLASPADLYRTMMTYRPTEVFHLGSILAGPCDDNPIQGFKINFESTMTLLDASRALNVRRFVMISSIAVFGKDAVEPVQDEAVKNPANVYGQTKLASEHMLLWYARQHGLDTRALRFAWVFGPGRKTGITALYSSLLLDAIANDESLEVTNPDETGDWLYVKDAVKAILTVWQAKEPGQRIYNVAGGVHSIRDVIEIAKQIKPGARITLREGGAAASPYPSAYDDQVFRKETGFKPDYTIEKAVREHLEIVSGKKVVS